MTKTEKSNKKKSKQRRLKTVKIVENTDDSKPSSLILLGARYFGKDERDAKKLLNKSQNGVSYPYFEKGFPRAHASYRRAKKYLGSSENYSKKTRTTSFLSRSDQDFVAHLALDTDAAEAAMDRLNKGSLEEVVEILASELNEDDLPWAIEYENGKPKGKPRPIASVKLVLRHHLSSYGNVYADVFVKSFYPKLTASVSQRSRTCKRKL